jgi:hypothetical protein
VLNLYYKDKSVRLAAIDAAFLEDYYLGENY